MTTAWNAFHRYVLPEVEGCPLPVATWAIRDAAIRFCAETEIWQEVQAPYSITNTPVLQAFVIVAPNARVAAIVEAQISGREIGVTTPESADRYFFGWRNGLTSTRPEAIAQVQTDKFALIPQPTTSQTLILTVALQPTRNATDGPDLLLADYSDTIATKAKATLMLMSNQKWSNPALAAVYQQMFVADAMAARRRNQNVFELGGGTP